MTQENGSEGSENPNRITGKHDRADGEDMVPFKKRVRFLWSDDLKEVINNKTECSGANSNDMKVSSTSGRTDAGEENKMELILTQKNLTSTTCNEDDFSSSLSQLAISESGGTGNEPRGDGGGKHEKESKELIEHTVVGGSGSCSQTGTVPPTRSGQNIEGGRLEEVQEPAMNDGSDGSSAPGGEEQSKGDIFYRRRREKQSSSPDEKPAQDQWAPATKDAGECVKAEMATDGENNCSPDVVGDEEYIQKTAGGTKHDDGGGGGGACSPTDTAFESRGHRSGEDERHEEVQNAATEVGEMSDDVGECRKDETAPEGEDDCGGDASAVACGKDETATEGDVGGGNGSFSPTNPRTKSNNGGYGEGDPEEQGKHDATEDDGLDEEPIEGGEKPLDYVVSTMIVYGGHDCSDNALGSSRYADTTAGSSEGNHHEQGQRQTAIEDDHHGTNPDADGGNGPPTFLVSAEGGHNDQIQQTAAFEDPDGDMQTQQYPMTTMDLRKRTRSIHEQGKVSHDVDGGDTPGQEARKKCKYGSDGGSNSALFLDGAGGYKEPPMQQANHSFLLFGVNIPCEQEPDVAINTDDGLESGNNHAAGGEFAYGAPPAQQPTDGIQLFGVYMAGEQVQPVATRGIQLFGVYITEEQVHSVDIQNRDRGNSHGRGESSMQRPRSGLRLFGFDF